MSAAPGQPDPRLLASDAEREQVVERLRLAGGEGRLTPEELEERSTRAYAARTRAELDAVLEGLPAPVIERHERGARDPERVRKLRAHAVSYVLVNLFFVVIWVASGANGSFWPIWPMAGWGLGLAFDAARTYGVLPEEHEHERGRLPRGPLGPPRLPAPPLDPLARRDARREQRQERREARRVRREQR